MTDSLQEPAADEGLLNKHCRQGMRLIEAGHLVQQLKYIEGLFYYRNDMLSEALQVLTHCLTLNQVSENLLRLKTLKKIEKIVNTQRKQ